MPVPKKQMKNHTFIARKGDGFWLAYHWFEHGTIGKGFPLGTLYANRDFSQITLTLFEQGEDGNGYSWNGGDGLMLTAPAKNRTEALRLANKLMEHSLKRLRSLN